jgi:hypothetical protein
MKTLTTLKKNSRRIGTMVSLFFVLSLVTACAQSRSYTLGVLQKTDYVINEASDIVDYFYYDDGEFIAKGLYFQDYAYHLYDSRRYNQAVQYSLKARSYAINAIEICDDYWQYYDYYYYGYSPAWGHNTNIYSRAGNVQLHFGLINAPYHNYLRVNWDLYFTTREWRYYHKLPSEVILLNNFYNYRGGHVVFNDRFRNPQIYINLSTRTHSGRDHFVQTYPNMTKNMAPKPREIKPANAPAPTTTNRRTVNSSLQYNTDGQSTDSNRRTPTGSSTTNNNSSTSTSSNRRTDTNTGTTTGTGNSSTTSSSNRRTDTNSSNSNTGTSSSATRRTDSGNSQSSTTTNRPSTTASQPSATTAPATRRTTEPTVNNRTNKTQETQAKKETTQTTSSSSSSASRTTSTQQPTQSSSSSSSSTSRRR